MTEQMQMLADCLGGEQRQLFLEYIKDLCTNDECFGIDSEFLGFMEDYRDLGIMLNRHSFPSSLPMVVGRYFRVVDVGCATALQHVFFKNMKEYIAVDNSPIKNPKFFVPNARFVRGLFRDVIDSLDIDEHTFGIANMSLLYQSGNEKDLELFNTKFKMKFII